MSRTRIFVEENVIDAIVEFEPESSLSNSQEITVLVTTLFGLH